MILVIDNYDSFSHNLARTIRLAGGETHIIRNDEMSVEEISALKPDAIVISPGPCTPDEAGVSVEVVRRLGGQIPMLGVCLGHQAIAQAYGGRVVAAPRPMHGKASEIIHDGQGLFAGLGSPFTAGRYHSLIVDIHDAPALLVSARTEDGVIMALRHARHPVYGVQFHPESILTAQGQMLIGNFLNLAAAHRTAHSHRKAA